MNQISALASNQLEAWENIAKDWILVPSQRLPIGDSPSTDRYSIHLICPRCDVSVYHAGVQSITPAILLAATVAHLRIMHRELDPDA